MIIAVASEWRSTIVRTLENRSPVLPADIRRTSTYDGIPNFERRLGSSKLYVGPPVILYGKRHARAANEYNQTYVRVKVRVLDFAPQRLDSTAQQAVRYHPSLPWGTQPAAT